jgi:fatty-acyl-CoA synthase
VTEDELHKHAQQFIDERPAWPKKIYVVDEIPLTTVGKIYKPSLHCEACQTMVSDLVWNELGLAEATVEATDGGARGMRVTVTLPKTKQGAVPTLEQALAAYLFEAKVQLG